MLFQWCVPKFNLGGSLSVLFVRLRFCVMLRSVFRRAPLLQGNMTSHRKNCSFH